MKNLLYYYGCRDLEWAHTVTVQPAEDWAAVKLQVLMHNGSLLQTTAWEFVSSTDARNYCTQSRAGQIKMRKGRLVQPFDYKVVSAYRFPYLPHMPLNGYSARKGFYVGMFREPRRRLLSAWNHNRHSFGLANQPRDDMLLECKTLKQFANHPRLQSCMTKMLLGRYCASSVDDIDMGEAVVTALGRLRYDFAFAGLVEHWNLSLCLFHRKFGAPMHAESLLNTRPAGTDEYLLNETIFPRLPADAYEELRNEVDDPYDFQVWLLANSRFRDELVQYGLKVPPELDQLLREYQQLVQQLEAQARQTDRSMEWAFGLARAKKKQKP